MFKGHESQAPVCGFHVSGAPPPTLFTIVCPGGVDVGLCQDGSIWVLLFYFFFFGRLAAYIEFPGQESDLRCSCDLSHGCGNVRSLTHSAGPAAKPVSQPSRDIADSVVPQWERLSFMIVNLLFCKLRRVLKPTIN